MAELFEVQKAAISKHLKNIFTSGELMEDSVVSVLETTAADGKKISHAVLKSLYRVRLKCHDIRKRWQRKRAGIKLFAKCIFYEFIR